MKKGDLIALIVLACVVAWNAYDITKLKKENEELKAKIESYGK